VNAVSQIRSLWDHAAWADHTLLGALRRLPSPPDEAVREFTHVLGAEEVWLSRLEHRPPRAAIWPTLALDKAALLAAANRDAYTGFIDGLTEARLGVHTAYTNSAGQPFETPVGEILMHVALHGQYHRGKVNVLLRQAGAEPAPVDFIAYVRGVAAARQQRLE
jgi:uncharacterized damage-inducible protein DinB